MKQSMLTPIKRRAMALLLALMLLVQAGPLTALTAHAEDGSGQAAESQTLPESALPEEPEVPTVDIRGLTDTRQLQETLQKAQTYRQADYAPGDWSALQEAISAAEAALNNQDLTQPEADSTLENLRHAMDIPVLELAEEAPQPASLTVGSAQELPQEIAAGTTVSLSADITLAEDQQIALIAGTLDGKGHTITLQGKPLALDVTGTIQNLGLASTVPVTGKQFGPSFGPMANRLIGGKILNSFSTATVTDSFNDAGGLVGESAGGTIRNSFCAGKITGMMFGGLIGNSANASFPSTIMDAYYRDGNSPVSAGLQYNQADGRFAQKSLEEMQTPEFVELLNRDIQDTGFRWEAVSGALPKLVVPKPANPQVMQAEDLPAEIPQGVTLELGADITLAEGQQIALIAGTLDGKGHTITLQGKPLAKNVTGTIQNLGVTSAVPVTGQQFGPSFGAMAEKLTGGTILNSFSTAPVADSLNDAGGLVGESVGGTIRNSFCAGNITGMMFGGLMGISRDESAPSVITEAYFADGDTPVSMGAQYNKDEGRFAKKSREDMKTAEFAALLNENLPATGYHWAAVPGAYPKLAAGQPEAKPEVSTADLEALITEAKALQQSDYTAQTWAVLEEALRNAETLLTKDGLTQAEVTEARKALQEAMDGLKKPLPTAAVELPAEGVISVTSAEQLNFVDAENTRGKFYRLENDIETSGYWFAGQFAGVLDGNGHTITISAVDPLFMEVTEEGVIQNVHFTGTTSQESAPAATVLRGAILNCRSTFSGNGSGFVKKLDGGIIANSLSLERATKGAFAAQYTSGSLVHSYWPDYAVNTLPESALTSSMAKTDKQLRTTEMRDLLNAQKGPNGTTWGQGSDGLPYFGDNKDYTPEGDFENLYQVQFQAHNAEAPSDVQKTLEVSPDLADNFRMAGTFTLAGVPEGSRIEWSCDDKNAGNTMAINMRDGRFYVYATGTAVVKATEFPQDGPARKVAEIEVQSAAKNITAIRLLIDGQDVTGGKHTVMGSSDGHITVMASIEGMTEPVELSSNLFRFVPQDAGLIHNVVNSGVFRFTKPGTTTMTVTAQNGVSAQVELTSQYVPVQEIYPSVTGVNVIHSHNSMYKEEFNTLETTVRIIPENASYLDGYTVSSSDPAIGYFSSSLPKGYVPMGAGDVTFTAAIDNIDPVTGEKTTITGQSQVSFVYKNPLLSVTGPETMTVTEYVTEPLPLQFTGKSTSGSVVTEPNLIWSYEGTGAVKITRPNDLQQIRDVNHPDSGNWVASSDFVVQGLRAGTVKATGTPVDQTAGAQPVVITFTVEPGEAPEAFDIPGFVAEGKQAATDYIIGHMGYSYPADDWQIFTLLRAGESLPQAELDKYYAEVEAAVQSWPKTQKPTDIARVALVLSILNKDITNIGGTDLAAMLYNHPALDAGSNELAWALIALDARNTPVPESAKWSRDAMAKALVAMQNADGGYPLFAGGESGVDTTAMALQALAPYAGQYKAANDKALAYLAGTLDDGFDAGNSEATSQTILALTVLGMDLATDPQFSTPTDNLMTAQNRYYVKGEGFTHTEGKVNMMATIQAMQALDAYDRLAKGQSSYWALEAKAPVDPEKPEYSFISGENQKFTQGEITGDAVLTVDGDFGKFSGVEVNGQPLSKAHYSAKAGSTVITLHKAYLDTLTDGTYKITVKFTDGEVTTRLFVEKAPVKPDPSKDIQVSFQLYGDRKHGDNGEVHTYRHSRKDLQLWVNKTVTVPENAVVMDAFAAAMAGESYNSSNGTYIRTVRGLSEFDNGPRSGWMYLLNGVHPTLGVAEQSLKNGDRIVFHYTDDYTLEDKDLPATDDQQAVKDAEQLIRDIGTVTKDSAKKIVAARKAYDALTAAQKKQVSNYNVLTAAEKKLAELNSTDADKQAAQQVEALIRDIGRVTADSAKKVEAARKAYNQLTDLQKALVSNYNVLYNAEQTLMKLSGPDQKALYTAVGKHLDGILQETAPTVSVIGGEWLVLGLARSGYEIPEAYYENVLAYVEENINDAQQLHPAKSTDNARVILALTALGKDVTNVAGHNLLMGLTDMQYVTKQGINGPIWALIALDSHDYQLPENPDAVQPVSREVLLKHILDAQLPDGGWSLAGNRGDVDITGMALQALAPYYGDNQLVKEAVEKALQLLSDCQLDNGQFSSGGIVTSEGSTQVIVALTALGIDPDKDPRFVKNGMSAIDGLCLFADGKGFAHLMGKGEDPMATEQGYYALTAYNRFLTKANALYDMTDVTLTVTEEVPAAPEAAPAEPSGGHLGFILIIVLALAGIAAAVYYVMAKKKQD